MSAAEKVFTFPQDDEPAPGRSIDLAAWRSGIYVGEPPPIRWLTRGTLPLGVPALLAAQGDTGKGMVGLQLGASVAFGGTQDERILGGAVEASGTVVIFTAEDDRNTVHRRLANIDERGARFSLSGERLIIVPLPDAGGPLPLFEQVGRSGFSITEHFHRIRDQLAAINDLALVIFDPLQSFAPMPINDDPAAGQFVCGHLAMLGADTGATILTPHHMRKNGSQAPTTLGAARDLIRGTSALVDGVRVAIALWPEDEAEAKRACKELGHPYTPKTIVRGGVVKSNGPARRSIWTYRRNEHGLLVDVTDQLSIAAVDRLDTLEALTAAIARAAERGQPFTRTGINGLYAQKDRLPGSLKVVAKHKLETLAAEGLERALIVQAVGPGGRSAVWLDVPGGPFAAGIGEFVKGATDAAA